MASLAYRNTEIPVEDTVYKEETNSNYATNKVYYRGQFYKTVDTSKLKYDPIDYYGQGEWNDSRHTP